jgi:hypothetical protein
MHEINRGDGILVSFFAITLAITLVSLLLTLNEGEREKGDGGDGGDGIFPNRWKTQIFEKRERSVKRCKSVIGKRV